MVFSSFSLLDYIGYVSTTFVLSLVYFHTFNVKLNLRLIKLYKTLRLFCQ